MLHNCLAWLKGRYVLGAILGLVGGPFFYWSGENLGAVRYGPGLVRNLTIVGIAWALAIPIVLVFTQLTWRPDSAARAAD